MIITRRNSCTLGLLGWLSLSCSQPTAQPPAAPIPDSEQLYSADFDGDGSPEILAVREGAIHWGEHTYIYRGGIHASAVGDLNGDGREEIFLGMGRSRTAPKEPPSILVVDSKGATSHPVSMPTHRVTDLKVGSKGLYLTVLGRDKVAIGGWWTDQGFEPQSRATMALTQAPLPGGRFALGCLYGEEPRSHGGLYLQGADGTLVRLPSLRGVRTLATADVNQDGHIDLLTGDGWHYRYGADARARLNLYLGPDFSDHRVLGEIPDNYTINQILPIQVDGEGPLEVLAVGTANLSLFHADSVGWSQVATGEANEQSRVAAGDTRNLPWIGIPGKPTQIREIPRP